MQRAVMLRAKPADFERLRIIVVMSFNLFGAADFAGTAFDFPATHIYVKIGPAIHAAPGFAGERMS